MSLFLCKDCDVDTSSFAGIREYYMVHNGTWHTAHNKRVGHWSKTPKGMLCIGCLEARLGRTLHPYDFTDCILNRELHGKSDRLLNRLGYTA